MNWYEKLSKYFPVEEMKSREHIELLLKERGDVYHKDEGPHHVLMYAEFDTFLFIDYLWVSAKSRGQGIGHQLIEKLKRKGKSIILEVEPIDYDDTDTQKRLRFYDREGFTHASSIGYNRKSLATNKKTPLEILYWSPNEVSEEEIYKQMVKMYESIHTYKDLEIYGDSYESVDQALTFKKRESKDIFDDLNT